MICLFMSSAFFDKALQAFSAMLLHSLWQGLLLAVVTGCALLLARKRTPAVRYLILCVCYGVFLSACVATFLYSWHQAGLTGVVTGNSGQTTTSAIYPGLAYRITQLADICTRYNYLIITVWLGVFVIRCWQMIRAVRYMTTIRGSQLQAAPEDWKKRLVALRHQLGINQVVQLFESGITRVPVVMGHLKPVIYVPLGMLSGLPADQVEAILLHELAHVRRFDYLVNLLQTIADAVFFFNPGLLWVSYLIKEEREHCCDDVVLVHTGNKKQFIEALIGFKEQSMQRPSLSLAFPGRKSQLIQRVSRIVYGRNNPFSKIEKGFLALSFLICLFVLMALGGSQWGPILASEPYVTRQEKVLVTARRSPEQLLQSIRVPMAGEGATTATSRVQEKNGRRKAGNTMPQPAGGTYDSHQEQDISRKLVEEEARKVATRVAFRDVADDPQHDEDTRLVEKARLEHDQLVNAREIAEQDMLLQRKQAEQQRVLADAERKLAEDARARAQVEREKADVMRQQAEKERERAAILRLEADRQRAHADELRKAAEEARGIAELERQKASLARKLADEQRVKATADRVQAERQRQMTTQYRQHLNTKITTDQSIPSTSH